MDEKVIRSLIFDVVLGAALKSISAAIPFLNLPVINQIFVFIVTKVAGVLYDEMSRYVKFTLIDIRTNAEKEAYEKAVAELKVVHDAPQKTPEEIARAKEKFKSTLRDLIRIKP